MPPIDVTAAIIRSGNRILIARRSKGEMAGFWEFPGGKPHPGEDLEECLKREILEELGLIIEVDLPFLTVDWDSGRRQIRLHSFLCSIIAGVPETLDHDLVLWIEAAALPGYTFAPPDRPVVTRLLQWRRDREAGKPLQ